MPRYKKPAGIYWLQSATTAIAGLGDRGHIWTYRLASLLGGTLAVLLCFWCARTFAIPEVAWLGAALMGTSLLLTAESTMATTDAGAARLPDGGDGRPAAHLSRRARARPSRGRHAPCRDRLGGVRRRYPGEGTGRARRLRRDRPRAHRLGAAATGAGLAVPSRCSASPSRC
ncbi:MAG: hypothetical protein WDM81_01710 [Rhizomicrobium sp.]